MEIQIIQIFKWFKRLLLLEQMLSKQRLAQKRIIAIKCFRQI